MVDSVQEHVQGPTLGEVDNFKYTVVFTERQRRMLLDALKAFDPHARNGSKSCDDMIEQLDKMPTRQLMYVMAVGTSGDVSDTVTHDLSGEVKS